MTPKIVYIVVGLLLFFFFYDAKAVMGAADQTDAERRLSTCQNNSDCELAYDEVWGLGAWALMRSQIVECGSEYSTTECGPSKAETMILRDCETDSDCMRRWDAIYGEGNAALRDAVMRECGASTPGVDVKDCEYWGATEPDHNENGVDGVK